MTRDPVIDRDYDVSQSIADAPAKLRRLSAKSAGVLAQRGCRTFAYGPDADEYIDFFVPKWAAGAPVHLFFHGGFWRAFSAKDYAFVAPRLQDAGIIVGVVNYSLCPSLTIGEIVEQCGRALSWAIDHTADLGADPGRITISGHSAGAQIVMMLMAEDRAARRADPAGATAACAISGLYDLDPLTRSWLQPVLNITPDIVQSYSPVYHCPRADRPILVAVGAAETRGFRAQYVNYLGLLGAKDCGATGLVVPDRDHISILDEFVEGGVLMDRLIVLASACEPDIKT